MSDQDLFEEFAISMRAETPEANQHRRAAVIAAASKKFSERRQEGEGAFRLSDQEAGQRMSAVNKGIEWMTNKIKLALAGGTALATCLVGALMLNTGIGTQRHDANLSEASSSLDVVSAKSGSEQGFMSEELRADIEPIASLPVQAMKSAQAPEMEAAAGRKSIVNMAAPAPMMEMAPMAQLAAPGVMPMPMIAMDDMISSEVALGGTFEGEKINGIKRVSEDPVSTFSIDVDTASWSASRRMIQSGMLPPADAVRIEEMVNYFPYAYMAPAEDAEHPFATHVTTFEAPWNAKKQLVRIGIQGKKPEILQRPALDLVFLVDTSGSMRSPDKLGLLKQSLAMMLPELGEDDRIGIVAYAGSAGTVLEMTSATSEKDILKALASLEAGGSTAGAAGLRAAYDLLGDREDGKRIGRVILATDGDFNVGMSSTEEMKTFIEEKRDTGAYLSVLGFGQGNYNDALMQVLAQNGNGQAAYIDTLSEARKVLVDELSGALFPIANDVKIQVEWNPDMVQEYRLIGYETRALAREDFNNDKVDAGEIGAGHQVTALYEIVLKSSDAAMINPLRYAGEEKGQPDLAAELGYVNLRYKTPGEDQSVLLGTPISSSMSIDTDARFAAAVAGFAELMKDDRYLGEWTFSDAADLAASAVGDDRFGYRGEAVRLMRLAGALGR